MDKRKTSGTSMQRIGLFAGPVLALALLLFFDLEPGRPAVTRTAAVALLMAVWWMTEAVPLAATALLPVVLFPLLGIMDGRKVAPIYFNHVTFLFIGGFMVALAMQRWNLHRRIALRVLLWCGVRPRWILLGFMVSNAFLSMWISNTATTMMMVPIVLAVVLANFVLLAFLWLFRNEIRIGDSVIPGWSGQFPGGAFLNDGSVAMGMALLLFLTPARGPSASKILDRQTVAKLPWRIILLFGGGFALATGFIDSGLSMWFGHRLSGLSAVHPLLLVAILCLMITFLTELTSNTATAEMFLPILAALGVAIQVNPLLLMVPATLSCSFAFMLPVATPPNAIVFGTDRRDFRIRFRE